VTLPQVDALGAFWASVPPAPVQLKRIALALGIPEATPPACTRSATPQQDAMQQALAAGLPAMEGRPDDPMLDLIGL